MNDCQTGASEALSVRDAARELSISRSKLYLLFAAGDLEAKKIGRRTIVARATIKRFMSKLPVAEFEGKRAP